MLICPQSCYCLGNYKHNKIHILHITEGNDIVVQSLSFINVHLHTKSLYTHLKNMKQQTPCHSSQYMLTY